MMDTPSGEDALSLHGPAGHEVLGATTVANRQEVTK